jgi:hypothetical protein
VYGGVSDWRAAGSLGDILAELWVLVLLFFSCAVVWLLWLGQQVVGVWVPGVGRVSCYCGL